MREQTEGYIAIVIRLPEQECGELCLEWNFTNKRLQIEGFDGHIAYLQPEQVRRLKAFLAAIPLEQP